MRGILILCAVLLAGEVWAGMCDLNGKQFESDPDKCTGAYFDVLVNWRENVASVEPVIAVAGEAPNGDWKKIKVDKDGYVIPSPCHQRMQEAMILADAYFSQGLISTAVRADRSKADFLRVVPSWRSTMRDCVTGK